MLAPTHHGLEPDWTNPWPPPTVDCGGTLVDRDGTLVCGACGAEVFRRCTDNDQCGTGWLTADAADSGEVEHAPNGDLYCAGCYQADLEYASTMVRFHVGNDDGPEKVLFGKVFQVGDDGETPRWFDDLFDGHPTTVWVQSSGWRGYHNTISILQGVTSICHGWATGDYDDVPWKKDTHRLMEILDTDPPEVPIFVLMEPTSNVFSMGTDVFCKDADVEGVTAYLDLHGFSTEALERAFS